MSRRRLLDVAAIFNASRGIAVKYFAYRKGQLDLFNKTSSLAESIKSQTEKATLTLEAALALNRRLRETTTRFSSQRKDTHSYQQPANDPSKARDSSISPQGASVGSEPNRYEKQSTTKAAIQADNSVVKQEQDVGGRSPFEEQRLSHVAPLEDLKGLQKQTQKYIPSQNDKPLPTSHSDSDPVYDRSLPAEQIQNVSLDQPTMTGPALSALSYNEYLENTKGEQPKDDLSADKTVSQEDVYSPRPTGEQRIVQQSDPTNEAAELTEEPYAELFKSSKVAKKLRGTGKYLANPVRPASCRPASNAGLKASLSESKQLNSPPASEPLGQAESRKTPVQLTTNMLEDTASRESSANNVGTLASTGWSL